MKAKNLVIHSDDKEKLKSLYDDYRFIGRDAKLEENKLIVFAVDRKLKTRRQRMRDLKNKRKPKVSGKHNV